MNLTAFRIEKTVENENVVLYPTLIQNAGRNYLVDCGYEQTAEAFETELNVLGVGIKDLNGIIITHDDDDHLGGLHPLKQKNQKLKIYCGEHEKDSVSGKIKSERLVQAESLFNSIPEENKSWALNFIRKLKNVQRLNPDVVLKDNDTFENEIIVVHTPGHTKGHISLFYPKEKTLIAGDSLVIENGEFDIANPHFTLDMEQAIKSVEKIKNLAPRKIICYHGGIMDENVSKKLETLIDKYKNQD
jgi:glyoxylase-like metal-dependent hydrolase (beta-lactamase superfamily II)